jgi:hypothetical protein
VVGLRFCYPFTLFWRSALRSLELGISRLRLLYDLLKQRHFRGVLKFDLLTSLPASRDCPMGRRFFFLSPSHNSRPRRYRHINHLLLFSNSLPTRRSICDDLMCLVDPTVDQSVAAVHLCLDFASCAETVRCAGEVETRCARFTAASGSS